MKTSIGTVRQWKDSLQNESTKINELQALNAELLETLNQIAQRANFMLVRNPSDNQADYILQQAKAAITKAKGGAL